jgi:hypothetical protein
MFIYLWIRSRRLYWESGKPSQWPQTPFTDRILCRAAEIFESEDLSMPITSFLTMGTESSVVKQAPVTVTIPEPERSVLKTAACVGAVLLATGAGLWAWDKAGDLRFRFTVYRAGTERATERAI